ncbi:NACHT and WD repeat domain-containing protein 2-like [Pleurodeles waltl]
MQKHQKDVKELGRCFIDFLNASFQQNPLVLILDVLDHIAEDDNARSLWWLPESFPPYVKIIISATLGTSEIFGNLKNLYKDQTLFLHLKPERKVCNEYLKQSLLENQRKVTSGQQMYVNRCLGKNTSPLMVNLLFKELMQWRSHEDVSDQTLGDSVHESIERLFLRLEEKYGRKFVSRALGYITLSRSGIGETELVDILSTDDTVAADFVSSNQATDIWRVPESLVACLVLALRGCLSQRLFMGSMVLCWTHFCYQLVVFKQYLSDATVVHDLHTTMGHYFSGRWACGRPKPYLKCDHLSDSKRFSKMFIDRQQPSQPWLYGSQSSDQRSTIANLRKVHELPFHLKNCGRQEEHSTNMLTIYPVYQAMIKAQQLHLLLSEVEDTAQLSRRTELKVIGDILRESSCLLSQNPGALGMVFQAAILPLTTEYPSLLKLLKQAYHESLKSSVIVAMHSSLVTVATKCVTSIGPSGIISILEMQAGSLIIVVFVNGALYTWNEIQPLTLVYRPSQDIEARDVELSHDGRHLVVLTGSNSLMILDCATWGIMSEINGSRLPATPSHNSLDLKGLKVFGSNVYVWFKNASLVRVFHNMSGSSLSELHCPQYVTCLSSTKHGKYVLVGQQSIVSIFDNSTFSHQSAISCTFEGHCIKVVYVSESDTEVYIVDTIGNISAWDILDPCQPQYLDEIHNSEESSEVISVEHSSDFKLLLLCKQNHVQVWNTDGWSMDEFTAPKNNSFSCALFLEDCKHIIAAMKTGTSLLVWRRDCGQCVLQLRNAYGEAAKLTKCLQQRCLVAVTKGGYITTWNMDLVQHAASMFKAKQPIRSILLCPSGEHLYASDGSEMVYKWRSSSFVVKAVLKHDHPIASTQLTVTGEFLVTLETFGDLYIWSTNTGENLFRIRGSQASQVLLTPNGHFGVTLCKNSVSRVWKLTTGHVVCTFHTHLQPAYISPESTFIMGINRGDLTAFSLWSGCVSKTFQCNEQSNVLAFQTLLNHPDITVVITTRRNIYTWNMAEETICYQMELPSHFPSEVSDCQMSSDGSIIMSMAEQSIHVLNTHSGKLGRLCTDGKVLYQHLSKDGRKVFFVSFINENQWDCDFHANPVLQVVQVSNGETIGQYFLGKMPSCFTVSEDDVTICIGYDDGTIGVYTVIESDEDREQLENSISFKSKYAQGTTAIKTFLSKEIPDIMWMDSHDVFPEE